MSTKPSFELEIHKDWASMQYAKPPDNGSMSPTHRPAVKMLRWPTLAIVVRVLGCLSTLVLLAIMAQLFFRYLAPCYWVCADKYFKNFQGEGDAETARESKASCISKCADNVLPLVGPHVIYIVRACLVFGISFKTSYRSFADYIAVRIYDVLQGLLLLAALIMLLITRLNGKTQKFIANMLTTSIAIGGLCLILHIVEAVNHSNPPMTSDFPPGKRGEKALHCDVCYNSWFPPLLKVAKCVVSLGIALVWLGMQYDKLTPFYGQGHIIWYADYSLLVWHAVVCFMMGSWNGRYQNRHLERFELALYVIDLLLLLALTVFHFIWRTTIVAFHVVNLVIWIIDFSLHRFPNHRCC